MSSKGSFDVTLEPQEDKDYPAGRMTIDKEYSGALVGRGVGQMLSHRTDGVSVYSAIEVFTGELEGKKGSFTLFHTGLMSASGQDLKIIVVEGSGTGDLKNIRGELDLVMKDGKHFYTINYSL